MFVDPISLLSNASSLLQPTTPATQVSPSQIRSDFNALNSALKAGNLTSAQQAFAQLETDSPQVAQQATSTTNPSNQYETLANALQSGNLSAAQTAFSAI